MANMADAMTTPITADPAIIANDLRRFTARWGELNAPSWLEIRAFDAYGKPSIAHFRPSDIDDATAWVAQMNGYARNIYAVRNPIRDNASGRAASDADILAAFFLWADCDDAASGANVLRWEGPKHTAAVITGTIPDTRVHVYWELTEPVYALDAWRDTQQAIARHFSSDPSVVNPSRIMRVAGTVSWPSDKKRERGYLPERTALRTEYSDERGPIPFERAQRVWPQAQPTLSQQAAPAAPQAAPDGMFAFNMGDHGAGLDRDVTRASIEAGSEWHNNVIRLIASYVGRGLADSEIHALTQSLTMPGYTGDDTAREVQTAIDGARRKGWTPEPPQARAFDHAPMPDAPAPASDFDAPTAAPADTWRIQSAADFIAGFVSPEWLIEGILQRGRLYTLTAPTGHGKTAAALYMASAISEGEPFCDLDTESGSVLFLAGENPDDVRARVIIALEAARIRPEDCRIHFVPGTFSIRQDMARLRAAAAELPDLALVIVDTFAAYFDGDDENSNAQALDFARVVRSLTALPSRPAVLMPAHPVKNATQNNLTPKGGSSLLNEVDGNLTVWREERIMSLHWQGKIRGPEFEAVQMELTIATSVRVIDKRGVLMPSVIASPVLQMRAMELASEAVGREDALLLSLADSPSQSVASRCIDLRLITQDGKAQKSTLHRLLVKLREDKLIARGHRKWKLTAKGEEAVDEIRNGDAGAPDA
jgi:hypothetical protein